MYCKQCGKEIDEDSLYCQFCGAKQDNSEDVSEVDTENNPQEDVDNTDVSLEKMGINIHYPKYICTACGTHSSYTNTHTTGGDGCVTGCLVPVGFVMGIVGLFFYVIPGIIIFLLVGILSSTASKKVTNVVCPTCGAKNTMIYTSTPRGKILFKETYPNYEREYVERVIERRKAEHEEIERNKQVIAERKKKRAESIRKIKEICFKFLTLLKKYSVKSYLKIKGLIKTQPNTTTKSTSDAGFDESSDGK